jgi:hypothetical protein
LQKSKTLLEYCPTNIYLETYAWNVISGLKLFTADDLHVLEKEIELHNRDSRVIGAILKSFERQGKIRKVGYVKSKRKETCHGRPILQWEHIKKPETKNVKNALRL